MKARQKFAEVRSLQVEDQGLSLTLRFYHCVGLHERLGYLLLGDGTGGRYEKIVARLRSLETVDGQTRELARTEFVLSHADTLDAPRQFCLTCGLDLPECARHELWLDLEVELPDGRLLTAHSPIQVVEASLIRAEDVFADPPYLEPPAPPYHPIGDVAFDWQALDGCWNGTISTCYEEVVWNVHFDLTFAADGTASGRAILHDDDQSFESTLRGLGHRFPDGGAALTAALYANEYHFFPTLDLVLEDGQLRWQGSNALAHLPPDFDPTPLLQTAHRLERGQTLESSEAADDIEWNDSGTFRLIRS